MTLIEQFIQGYCGYHSISVDRQREYRAVLEAYEKFARRPLEATTADDMERFMHSEIKAGRHANTVRKKGNMLRCFYGWAFDKEHIDAEVYARVQRVRDPRGATTQSEPKPYSADELQRFWQELDARYPVDDLALRRFLKGGRYWRYTLRVANTLMHAQAEAIFGLALYVGMRRNEILLADIDDIHYDNQYVVVLNGARKNRQGLVRTRQLPMIVPLHDALKKWIDLRARLNPPHDRPWLSLSPYGPRAQRVYLNPMSEDAMEAFASQVGQWELHRFRHTCATVWLKKGMPIDRLRDLLGHANIQQTLAYAKLDKTDLTKYMDDLGGEFATAVGRST
jgi:integrase